MSKIQTNPIKTTSFIAGLVVITFLVSCSSSNQLASSFGKRKYMKGHFSDPVSSIKGKLKPANTVSDETPVHDAQKVQMPVLFSLSPVVVNGKVISQSVIKPAPVFHKKQAHEKFNVVARPIPAENNSSLQASSDETITTYKHEGGELPSGAVTFGRFILYMFLLGLLFLVLAFAAGSANPVFFAVLIAGAVIFFLFAIIFTALYFVIKGQKQ
jgi:hypothetical protein